MDQQLPSDDAVSPLVVARRGTWRVADGAKVDGATARAGWAQAARPILLDVARRYGDYITYKDVAERVQNDSGIRTTQRMDYWIGKVLGEVARECVRRREPLLSAFCVHADETVGAGYATVARDADGFEPADPDVHAAEERLKAHRFHGAELPADGGSPRLPPRVIRRRARTSSARPRPPRTMCPNCFIEVNVDGVCGSCS